MIKHYKMFINDLLIIHNRSTQVNDKPNNSTSVETKQKLTNAIGDI